nr:zinc finger, CCHC-type [Tanacetum cinerariifolium]
MRDSCGGLLIKVTHITNRLYKIELKVDVGVCSEPESGLTRPAHNESREQPIACVQQPNHHTYSPEHKDEDSERDDTPIPVARLETIRLLIALAAAKGWKIHHLYFKTAFLHGDLKELDNTLKEMGFLQCVQLKAIYRTVPNGEFIIVAVYVHDLFVNGTSLELIHEFKKRMTSQFEMSDLGELTYYVGIKVSQEKDRVKIKQERYARKILKEARMKDCIATLCPIEP